MKGSGSALASFGMSFMNAMPAAAQNMSYGAENFYLSDNVTYWPINFQTRYDMKLAGNIFFPYGLDRTVNNSAIIVGQPLGAVKA